MHDKLSIIAIKYGNIKLHLKFNDLILKKNTLAIINPYEMHSASKMNKTSKQLYALYLDKKWIEKLQKNLFNTRDYIVFTDNLIKDVKLYSEFVILCENLFLYDLYIKKEELIVEFISSIMLKYSNKILIKDKNILAYDIKEYIDKNLSVNISLENISNEFLITPFHLIRVFKKELNLSPYQYILNQKVTLAKDLLSKDLSISEVAYCSGFNDQSHLYKYFKQIFSISPKEYQDSLLKY